MKPALEPISKLLSATIGCKARGTALSAKTVLDVLQYAYEPFSPPALPTSFSLDLASKSVLKWVLVFFMAFSAGIGSAGVCHGQPQAVTLRVDINSEGRADMRTVGWENWLPSEDDMSQSFGDITVTLRAGSDGGYLRLVGNKALLVQGATLGAEGVVATGPTPVMMEVLIEETRLGTTTYRGSKSGLPGLPDSQEDVGGWEDYPEIHRAADWDTDGDGMPNTWETKTALNPHDAADGAADPDGDGYTHLEDYLNWLAAGNTLD